MNDVKKASFDFEKFKIQSFSFNESTEQEETLAIKFEPSGIFYESDSKFELFLSFKAYESDKVDSPVIQVNLVAYFRFQNVNSLQEIPQYFYKNVIAIVFPFLRAFISTLTLQANIKLVVLPVLNLSALEQPLKENTRIG